MSYSIATEYDSNLVYECRAHCARRADSRCVGRCVVVRNRDGSLNMEFYEAQARRARSEAFADIGRSIVALFRR